MARKYVRPITAKRKPGGNPNPWQAKQAAHEAFRRKYWEKVAEYCDFRDMMHLSHEETIKAMNISRASAYRYRRSAVEAGWEDKGYVPRPSMRKHEFSITCPKCNRTSYNFNDIKEGYCGNCHDWTSPRPHQDSPGTQAHTP